MKWIDADKIEDDEPTANAIPIEWIKEWIEEHHEYASRVTITWLLDDWEEKQC